MTPNNIGMPICGRGVARRRATRRRRAVCVGLFCASFALISYRNYDKGLFLYDEGYNLLEARFVYQSAKLALGYVALRDREGSRAPGFRDYVKLRGKPDGQPLRYAKPLHTLILAAGLTASGGATWGPYAAIALIGAGVVVLTFLAGRSIGSPRLGIAAALLLAGSGYFLNYAREALAEVDSAFFYLLAAWVYLPSLSPAPRSVPWKRLWAAGLCAGLAFTANYRWFWIPLVFAAMEARRWWTAGPWGRRSTQAPVFAQRLGSVLAGFFLPAIAFEIPFLLAAIYFKSQGLGLPFETYFEQLGRLYFAHPTSQRAFDLAGWQTYLYLMWKLQHPLVLGLFFAGLWEISRRGRPSGRLWLALNTAAPMAFYSFYTFKFARFLTLSLPFMAMVEARGLEWLVRRLWPGAAKKARAAPSKAGPPARSCIRHLLNLAGRPRAVLLTLLFLAEASRAWEVFSLRSPYAEAQQYLAAHGASRFLSTEVPICRWYAGREGVEFPAKTWPGLVEQARQGYRWIVVGPLARYWGPLDSLARLERTERPVKVYANPAGACFLYRFEHNRDFRRTLEGVDFEEPGVLRIYRAPS